MHEWGSAAKQSGIRSEPAPADAIQAGQNPGNSECPRRPDQGPLPFENFPGTSDTPLQYGTKCPAHTRCEDPWGPGPQLVLTLAGLLAFSAGRSARYRGSPRLGPAKGKAGRPQRIWPALYPAAADSSGRCQSCLSSLLPRAWTD